jgi:peptide/nickel transport system permease protein
VVSFLLRRLLRSVLTVLGVITIAFLLLRLSGNPARLLLAENATEEQVAALTHELGYDRPIVVQYVDYLGQIVRGDFGESVRQSTSSLTLVLERLPVTIQLGLTAFAFGIVTAFIAAVVVQFTGARWLREVLLWIGSVRQAVPAFLFGILLVLLFSVTLGWLPSIGAGSYAHLVLPAVTLGTFEFALYLRLFDSALSGQGSEDYVRTARAKGQHEAVIILTHMLPNALLPVLTVAGLNLGALLGGAAVIEIVFNWPGVGQLMVNSVNQRDFPVVQTGLLVISVLFVLVNFLVDLVQSVLDPRVRLS